MILIANETENSSALSTNFLTSGKVNVTNDISMEAGANFHTNGIG